MQKYEVQKEFNGYDATLLGYQAKGTILSDDVVNKDYLEALKSLGYIVEKGKATKQIQEDVKSMDEDLVGTVVGGDKTEDDETEGDETDEELKNEAGVIDNTVVVGSEGTDETEGDETGGDETEGDGGVDLDDEVKSSTEEVGTETLAEKLQKATTKDELKDLAKTQKGLVDATKWNKSVDAIKADLIASAL